MRSTGRLVAIVAATAVALVALLFVAVNTGSLQVGPVQLLRGLLVAYDDAVATVYDLRFPRVFIAVLGGAATAASGVLLQAAIRNPLADPGVIGISAGASLAAVVVTAVAPAWFFFMPAFACAGGMAAFALVYTLSWRGGLSPLRITLVGVAVAAACQGVMAALDAGTGSTLSGVAALVDANITMKTWDDWWTLVAYSAPAMLLALAVAGRCDLLALDDKTARGIGFDIDRNRLGISAIAVLLASAATAIIGPVSFLGLLAPHIARIAVGERHRVLIPYAMLLGAALLLAADTVGRTVAAPYEISAAIIMSVVGGPVFIALLRRARGTYAG